MMEAFVAISALEFAQKMGLHEIEVKGDALSIIKLMQSQKDDLSIASNLIEESKSISINIHSCIFMHTGREMNRVAGSLARFCLRKNDGKTTAKSSTSGSTIKGFLRAVGAGSESSTIAADTDAFGRPITSAGEYASPPTNVDGDDIAGGIRLVDARDIGFLDDVWIGYFLYRVHVDALGFWFGHGFLHCWDCFNGFHVRSFYSLSRHGPFFAAKGYSW
ncbi:hypothetical protein CRYUN_Cryun21dG0047200 [Craigia yunnanensis]